MPLPIDEQTQTGKGGGGNPWGESPCANKGGYPKRGLECGPNEFEVSDDQGQPWCCTRAQEDPNKCTGGYKGAQVVDESGKRSLLKPCNAGYKSRRMANDEIWCCPEGGKCASKEECQPDEDCVEGECKKTTTPPTGDCPEGIGSDKYEGCSCGKKYTTMTGKCAPGYALISRTGKNWEGWKEGAVGKCECIKWCKAIGYGEDCNTPTNKTGQSGEFKWSGQLQALLKRLSDRIQSLFDNPRGTTEQERQTIINYMTEGIKRGERPRLQSMQDQMSRMGLMGSGLELGEFDRIKRGTDELTANAKRQVAIDELDRRFRELTGTSGLIQSLLGTSMSAEQIPEVLSAARRGEGRQDMSMLMNYFSTLMGGQNSAYAPYLQAFLNQYQNQQGQGGDSSWLPWLMYLLMPQGTGGTVKRK